MLPAESSEESECARTIISTLASKAFRRPATDADVEEMMAFFEPAATKAEASITGSRRPCSASSRIRSSSTAPEIEPASSRRGRRTAISDLELASRLSFFLWSSIPDEELIELAAEGRLHDAAVLEQQVERMIADPRSEAFIENFTGQWLNVRGMQASEPVVDLFPDFDSTLREAFRREIELFFGSVIHEDRSILDLLTADYTFVNERLAKHYGIPDVYGAQFRRVTLGPELDMRRGLLGKGALLTITSDAARTSPVKRGKWFLETFLGISPPDPPPGRRDRSEAGRRARRRKRCARGSRRTAPTRAAPRCHQSFEPMGLAMENFDAVGAWRTLDAGQPIDPTGVTNDGTPLDGVHEPARIHGRATATCSRKSVTEKLLTYAIGRGLEYAGHAAGARRSRTMRPRTTIDSRRCSWASSGAPRSR